MATDPTLPIPISLISGRYLLFSIDAVTYLRREYHICGVLIGAIPQHPQQNVFLGLPLELMPEEARLLVEKDVAYIVDDTKNHTLGMQALMAEDRRRYLERLKRESDGLSQLTAARKEQKREKRLKELNVTPSPRSEPSQEASSASRRGERESADSDSLFELAASTSSRTPDRSTGPEFSQSPSFSLTPPTSDGLIPNPPKSSAEDLPDVPASYPLFAHLHSKGYFISPGLRFGCQYLAYPGDPLRFHSHFLAVGVGWEEEIDLMTIVGGGRLGTGVKKGFLVGAADTSTEAERGDAEVVRTFSIEWAGM